MTRKRIVRLIYLLSLTVMLSACGTLFHPERKGTVSGSIDPAIAILDGLGLLVYFVPGVIAFAVDFNNGTIYLPQSEGSGLDIPPLELPEIELPDITLPDIDFPDLDSSAFDADEQNFPLSSKRWSSEDLQKFARLTVSKADWEQLITHSRHL